MTQIDYEIICRIIQSGAPALAMELIGALQNLINDFNAVIKERDQLKSELETIEKDINDVQSDAK